METTTLPLIESDFYFINAQLSDEERNQFEMVRHFMETEVEPIITDYWKKDEFPKQLIPKMAELKIAGLSYSGYNCPGKSVLLDGLLAAEMARIDPSVATFMGVHGGLAMGSIYLCGSEAQKEKWLVPMSKMELIGAFALTEPLSGSDTARGLQTTCKRIGNGWVLNGEKKWIGNAGFADVVIVWARDVDDQKVKGFLVEKGTAGFTTTKIENKIALRCVENAHIVLEEVYVSEENRLQNALSFKNTAEVLRMTRAGVAWLAVGCAQGAYEKTVQYVHQRTQFGKNIGSFQLVQERLARMLGNVTAAQCMTSQLTYMQGLGFMGDHHASLAKMQTTLMLRETVALGRETLGGNGILLDYHVARFFCDAEAIYSYEGTKDMNSLIVGRGITGMNAFV